tara:strand:- start:3179 stop:3517 length:339 start_codon:yes stop_codon:yes gene_type:complete
MSDLDELEGMFASTIDTIRDKPKAKALDLADPVIGTQLRQTLESQHAIHGVFGRVYERLGGEEMVMEWADENRGKFISLLVGMAPNVAPTSAHHGDINIQINNNLISTALDG